MAIRFDVPKIRDAMGIGFKRDAVHGKEEPAIDGDRFLANGLAEFSQGLSEKGLLGDDLIVDIAHRSSGKRFSRWWTKALKDSLPPLMNDGGPAMADEAVMSALKRLGSDKSFLRINLCDDLRSI